MIIVNDSSRMLPLPITRIYKDWSFMWMRTSTTRILPSRQSESLLALGHYSWSDLIMVLSHSEAVLCGPCEGLKCRVSHTTPSQPPVLWGAEAWPTDPTDLDCSAPNTQCLSETVWETKQGCNEEHGLNTENKQSKQILPWGRYSLNCLGQNFYQFLWQRTENWLNQKYKHKHKHKHPGSVIFLCCYVVLTAAEMSWK